MSDAHPETLRMIARLATRQSDKTGSPVSAEAAVALGLAADRIEELEAINHAPDVETFFCAVEKETRYQRQLWGAEHDEGKTDADWFWLVGYLAGKALTCAIRGEADKALHHL